MNRPNPAIVSQAGARPLARWALLLVCAAYLLPGQFGRDAWRHADLVAFGFVDALAEGRTGWLRPLLAGQPTPDGALLPYWLGALSVKLLPLLDAALAARLPFLLALALVLALVWYATFHLSRTDAAQPVSFAFGGEAGTLDYARAMADCAVLALMASLGLLQLGHETTPELLQLLGVAWWLYALAAAPFRRWRARLSAVAAILVLALSGAAQFAVLLGLGGFLLCQFSRQDGARQARMALALAVVLAIAVATALELWRWRLQAPALPSTLRLLAWFTWPTAALAAWTVWRWRGYLSHRHVSVPLTLAALALLACMGMGGSERALLLALPGLALLAAFALPTLSRSLSAMLDWFSLFFFSAAMLALWLYFAALHTNALPRMSRSLQRLLAEDWSARFDGPAFFVAIAGSVAWLLLVRWRTSRQRQALWRSLVLPAGGTAVVWLLAMTLMLPALDHARSNRTLLGQLQTVLPADVNCVQVAPTQLSLAATLEAQGGWTVRTDEARSGCDWAVKVVARAQAEDVAPGWRLVAALARPAERSNRYQVLRRQSP